MADFKRPETGRHVSLVDREKLYWISKLPPHIVPAFAQMYEMVEEFKDRPVWDQFVRGWLDRILMLNVSAGARGRDDLVEVLRGAQDNELHQDYGKLPQAPKVLPQKAKNGAKERFRGLKPGA